MAYKSKIMNIYTSNHNLLIINLCGQSNYYFYKFKFISII